MIPLPCITGQPATPLHALACAAFPTNPAHPHLQAAPELITSNSELLAEFRAAPWLLPKRTAALPYAGINDFAKLVEMRAGEVDGYSAGKAISVTYSNFQDAFDTECIQNYSACSDCQGPGPRPAAGMLCPARLRCCAH